MKSKAEPNAAGLLPGDEVIDSDLDDSDDEGQGDADGEEDVAGMDIVFCVYDKVSGSPHLWPTSRAHHARGSPVLERATGINIERSDADPDRWRGSRTSGRRLSRTAWCTSTGGITCLQSAWGASSVLSPCSSFFASLWNPSLDQDNRFGVLDVARVLSSKRSLRISEFEW